MTSSTLTVSHCACRDMGMSVAAQNPRTSVITAHSSCLQCHMSVPAGSTSTVNCRARIVTSTITVQLAKPAISAKTHSVQCTNAAADR